MASINRQLIVGRIIFVVTRCERHSDYVEQVFLTKKNAEEYCNKYNNDKNEYTRCITRVKVKK